MRNISFALTTEQVRNKTKTVTRRNGWLTLKPGEVLCAVEKSQGLRKGEKIKRICKIVVISVTREPLNYIDITECIKEGFPNLKPVEFIEMFCKSHKAVRPESIITRIEFDYVIENNNQLKIGI